MTSAISEYLPMAAGIMLSPAPIIAMIVLCVIGGAKDRGMAFFFGFVIGIVLLMIFSVLLGSLFSQDESGQPSTFSIILKFAVAGLLLWLAWTNWKSRPAKGDKIKQPDWIAGLEKMSAGGIFGLGLIVNILSFKNIPFIIGAAVSISQSVDSWGAGIFDAFIFALVAALGIALPWLITIFGGDKVKPMLEDMRDWLYLNNNIIMTIVFLLLGISSLGQAFGMLA